MTSDANLQDYDELSVPEKILRLQDHYDGKGKSAPWSEVRERIRKER